jgi:hypothetical protein
MVAPPVYQQLLLRSPEGITFLFSTRFSNDLQVAASQLSVDYNVTADQAIEELRRLPAIKAFTEDHNADKISPTTLMVQFLILSPPRLLHEPRTESTSCLLRYLSIAQFLSIIS